MLEIKEQIVSDLKKIIKDLINQDMTPELFHPKDERHADYSSNIAMAIFSSSKFRLQSSNFRTPLDFAKEIVEKFRVQSFGKAQQNSSKSKVIDRVEAVSPGFINFWLSKDYLNTLMIDIIRAKDEYGESKKLANKKIMVEFTDPNPFKEFHIGHLYSNTVGESLCRLLESQEAYILRACYQGDVGLHVAKALYGIQNSEGRIQNEVKLSLKEKVRLLGKAYALGVKAYEQDDKNKREIEKINKQIYEEDSSIMALYKKGREWSLQYFARVYERLGTKFKKFYFESEAGEVGLKIVKSHIGDVFEKSKGAVIFRGEKYGLHNRVFVNSLGLPTYEAKDLGLALTKYKDFPCDLSIIITAREQSDYFRVVLKALSLITPELAEKTKHIAHGVVRLPMGKMSSRTGTVLTGEWLLDEVKRRIIKKYKEIDQDTAEKVAVGSVKYALLKSGIGRDIAFDFDESISLEGNSGPYLQYAYARTQSVLRKSEIRNSKHETNSNFENLNFDIVSDFNIRYSDLKLQNEEGILLRTLYRFPEVVEEAAEKFAPNLLCNYLFDLGQRFNLFYQKVPILHYVRAKSARSLKFPGAIVRHPRGVNVSQFRLCLTMAVGQIIKNGLHLLGIEAPARM